MAEMMPQSALVPDSDYIIIGGTGDLALRKIFPALFWRFLDGQVTSSFRLIAAARQEISKKDFADRLRPFCEEALSHADTKDTDFESFLKLVHLVKLDILSVRGLIGWPRWSMKKQKLTVHAFFILRLPRLCSGLVVSY